jgi:transcriptional regulator with XRE-family HTH domain
MAPLRNTPGLTLKLERVANRLGQAQIAEGMGVSISRVSKLEAEAFVTDGAAARYRAAIAKYRTSGTAGDTGEQ